uniref:Exocyst complex component Sec3 C-terminal domain-containing protein n=1 Tax=Tetradesmus obliquus TaxID=3088 RepID=A0A383WIL7_TETOB
MVLAVLEPRALQQLQQQVFVEVNALLRRELRAAAGELRRGASAELAASGQAGEGDYNLCKEKGGSSSSSSAAQPRQRVARLSYGSGGSGPGSDSVSEWPADPTELSSGAAGASAAKRQAFLDGSVPGLPLHEAWSLLLGGFLPFLAAEAAFYADLLLLYRGDEERLRDGPDSAAPDAKQQRQGQASIAVVISRPPGCPLTYAGSQAVEGMLAGLEGDFVALSDLASRSHQVLLLPLLATALAWQQHLAAQPAAAPLAALLESLAGKLRGAWGSFCAGQVAAVEQYDSRSKMGLQQGIKHLHVLPFISQFCLMVHDLEVALVEGAAAAAAVAAAAPSQQQQQQQQQQQTAGDDGEEGQQSLEQAAAADAARSVRAAADALYDELCPRLLSRLERLASSDAKYGERCRLENYGYLGEALRGLAQKLPALQQHWQVAEARREAALSGYVAEQLAYSKLWKLLEFGDKLDALLKVVSPPEVSFQKDCSPAEVRSLMRSTMDGTDKKLEALAGRVRKHLGGGALFNVAWAAVKEALLARYEHLEWLLEQCYPTTPLRPSPEELRELFRATSAG